MRTIEVSVEVFPNLSTTLGGEVKDTCPLYNWRMANLKPGSDYLDVEIVGVANCITRIKTKRS
jgi:hypothetical protein